MEDGGMAGGIGSQDAPERRRSRRRRVLKRAQLIFGLAGSTIDCLVLDETAFGVQLETPVMSHFPDKLQIRFAGGGIYDAQRLWSTGTKLGLKYVGSRIYDEESLRQRKAVRLALKTQSIAAALHMLRDMDFFKSEALREASVAAELAVMRLSEMLD